jgi:uncharacterized membrane protein
MPRSCQKRKKVLILVTTITAVVLIVFIILTAFWEEFFACSYIVIGAYFAFFIVYQIVDIYKNYKG